MMTTLRERENEEGMASHAVVADGKLHTMNKSDIDQLNGKSATKSSGMLPRRQINTHTNLNPYHNVNHVLELPVVYCKLKLKCSFFEVHAHSTRHAPPAPCPLAPHVYGERLKEMRDERFQVISDLSHNFIATPNTGMRR